MERCGMNPMDEEIVDVCSMIYRYIDMDVYGSLGLILLILFHGSKD
jgi:hypothetical protein